ncbi:hypothetical protein AB205_0053390 [Aquarana catesbeiana]|uniref:Uncharacterized protein n=1 Tax=Aquarana catesbeiana TaxID=8400 RepID=A0A2G9S8R9_AQUCT|nr:hypothetical protein AB205_0053390 [Aquarana catesbeiana]
MLYLPALCSDFCTEQPRSSSSWVPLRCSYPLPPVKCLHSKQIAMEAPQLSCSSVCPFRHGTAVRPHPLS